MIIKKISIHFLYCRFGWLPFILEANNKPIINISASGVYGPFSEYVDILYDLKFSKKKKYTLLIDQEGYDAEIKVTNKGKNIFLETETLKDYEYRKKHDLKTFNGYFNKKQFISELSFQLDKFYKKNKVAMDNDWYNFSFNKNKLRKILLSK